MLEVGERFGRWEVIALTGVQQYLVCKCDCGTERPVFRNSLVNGTSVSCGCYNKERSIQANTKHGEVSRGKPSVEYTTWQAMLRRCYNTKNPRYSSYGGRGIKVCNRWQSFEPFLQDMERRPSTAHSLDRIDNDKDYEVGNCRWATASEQMTNRRNTLTIDIGGQTTPIAFLAKETGIPANTLRARIFDLKWDLEKALTAPVRSKR